MACDDAAVLARDGPGPNGFKALAGRYKRSATTFASLLSPGLRKLAAGLFAYFQGRPSAKLEQHTVGIELPMVQHVDQTRQRGRRSRRATVSHLCTVRKALAPFVSHARHIIYTEVSDDATMWVRKAPDATDTAMIKNRAKARPKAKLKGKRFGRNKATPVFTTVQHMVVGRCDSPTEVSQVHTPSTPLPKANWNTIASRTRKWNVLVGEDVGTSFACSAVVL